MPQPMNRAVMTNDGAKLLTRAQAGECRIELTRIAIGSGSYSEEEKTMANLQAAAALKEERNSYGLSDISVYSDYSVRVSALITNQDPVSEETLITEGFYINEMGLFAREAGDADGVTEILYSIAVTSGEFGDFMPPYNGYSPAQIIQEYYATVNNSAEVTIQMDNGGAVMLAKDGLILKNILANLMSYSEDEEALVLSVSGLAAVGGGDAGGGDYTLPIATSETLGGVKIGEGVKARADGTISVDGKTLVNEAIASDAEVREMLSSIFEKDI